MVLKIYLTAIIAVLLMGARCNGQADVTRIEFTSMTRGYQKQVFVDKDSVTVIVDGRQAENKVVKKAMAGNTWDAIQKELGNIDLNNVSQYKSPGNRRAFDGAKHSTLKFITKEGKEAAHTFDDLQPHRDLKRILDLVLSAENAEQP